MKKSIVQKRPIFSIIWQKKYCICFSKL